MICTTIEQSKQLLELGIDPKTADMYYPNRIDIDNYPLSLEWKNGLPLLTQEVPAWSLSALLELIPNPMLSLQFDQTWYCAGFISSGIVLVDKCTTPIDAAFQLVIKLKS